jgi:hypothetical protein
VGSGEVTEGSDPSVFLDVLRRVVEALDAWGRPYAIFGTVGTNVHLTGGRAEDVDVFVHEEDADAAVAALVASGFDAGERDPAWIFKAHRAGVLVDVIFRVRDGLGFAEEIAGAVRRARYRGIEVPVPAPEDLALIAACSAHAESPKHWFTAVRLVSELDLDWDRFADHARRLAPLRAASLLLYCRSEGIDVPDGILTSLLSS